MRTIVLLSLSALAVGSLQAQTVLTRSSHGLLPNHTNEMKLTGYMAPGPSGRNVVWDFQSLELRADFVGTLDEAALSKNSMEFAGSNTVLQEFGNSFYFNVTERGIEHHGFVSASGATRIVYTDPFVKMRYPFSFGSSYTGNFSGTHYTNGQAIGTVTGQYTVTADGLGTLLLPDHTVFENALRVKEVKSSAQSINGQQLGTENVTYRWYINGHRFPILVLIESTVTPASGRASTSHLAAYNSQAVQCKALPVSASRQALELGLRAFPNPYRDQLNIRFNLPTASEVSLSVVDMSGRTLKVLVSGHQPAGYQTHQFSTQALGLSAGPYLLKLHANGIETTQLLVGR